MGGMIFDKTKKIKQEEERETEPFSLTIKLIGEKFYVVNDYPYGIEEKECCDFSFKELPKILIEDENGCTYELGYNGCCFVTFDEDAAKDFYKQKFIKPIKE